MVSYLHEEMQEGDAAEEAVYLVMGCFVLFAVFWSLESCKYIRNINGKKPRNTDDKKYDYKYLARNPHIPQQLVTN